MFKENFRHIRLENEIEFLNFFGGRQDFIKDHHCRDTKISGLQESHRTSIWGTPILLVPKSWRERVRERRDVLDSQGRVKGGAAQTRLGAHPQSPCAGITRSGAMARCPGRLGLCLLPEILVLAHCQVGLPV